MPQVNYGLKVLEINAKVLEVQEIIEQQEIKEQVANTYFSLQAVTKQLGFIQGNIIAMDKLIANMQAMKKNDLVVQTEVDKLMINRLNLVNGQQTLEATKMQLEDVMKILIGYPMEKNLELAPDNVVEQTVLVDETVNRPELQLIDAQIEMNREERKGTNMAYLPSLAFYAAYNYTYNMKPDEDVRVGIESSFIGLRLDWTLFDGLEKMNKQKVNAINYEKMQNQRELAEQQLDMVSLNAKRQIEIKKTSLDLAKEKLTLAQRVYDQTVLQFNEGTIASNDMILADNSLQEAQTNMVAAYVQLRQAEIAYLKSIGNIK
jgi:outer membrane protein TolC